MLKLLGCIGPIRFSGETDQVGPPNPRYIEQWRYVTEFGIMIASAKISLLHARLPGPDRRNGIVIGKQSAAFVWHPTFEIALGELFPVSPLFLYARL